VSGIYGKLPPDFYDASLNSANPITRYYHENRYAKIRSFLAGRLGKGARILDIGCGSSNWNTDRLPVTGLDQNRDMLGYGMERGFIRKPIEWDLMKTPLPLKDGSFDIIVMSEVLEHLENPGKILAEASRILRKGGTLIITVPLDEPLSAWWVLFGLECLVAGDILGNEYYKNRCGHVNHFSEKSIVALCEKEGFRVKSKDVTLMNIGIAAEKA
jgi:SAM-dependent methyltransferase